MSDLAASDKDLLRKSVWSEKQERKVRIYSPAAYFTTFLTLRCRNYGFPEKMSRVYQTYPPRNLRSSPPTFVTSVDNSTSRDSSIWTRESCTTERTALFSPMLAQD